MITGRRRTQPQTTAVRARTIDGFWTNSTSGFFVDSTRAVASSDFAYRASRPPLNDNSNSGTPSPLDTPMFRRWCSHVIHAARETGDSTVDCIGERTSLLSTDIKDGGIQRFDRGRPSSEIEVLFDSSPAGLAEA